MADGPANECGLFWAALRSAAIWSDLQKLGIPGIQGVWSIPEAAGWGITVVSIKQMYAGHAPQVMALAAQCTGGAYFGKYVIVVDDDVDPSNIHQVLWAMATRSRPAQSIDILRETWSTFLDPSLNPPEIRPWGSKALINACMDYRYIKTFSKRTKLSKPMYEQVVARWNELGFAGKPMEVSVFEDSAPGTKSSDQLRGASWMHTSLRMSLPLLLLALTSGCSCRGTHSPMRRAADISSCRSRGRRELPKCQAEDFYRRPTRKISRMRCLPRTKASTTRPIWKAMSSSVPARGRN